MLSRVIVAFIIFLLLNIGGAAYAASLSCSGLQVPKGNKVIDVQKLSQRKFSEFMRYETNLHRCKYGLKAVSKQSGLLKAAVHHSKYIAKVRKLTHKENNRKYGDIMKRVKAFGEKPTTAAENTAVAFLYSLYNKRFSLPKDGSCKPFYTKTKQIAPKHSYHSLARETVLRLMNSKGHRANILLGRAKYSEAGLGFSQNPKTCGNFYIAQVFTN